MSTRVDLDLAAIVDLQRGPTTHILSIPARHTYTKDGGIMTTLSVHADPDEDGVSSDT